MYQIDAGYGKPSKDYATISEGLEDSHVVGVTRQADGRFRVDELCDVHFGVLLTKEQLRAWGAELIAMAEKES